jgi:hypothetical protein
MRPDVRAALDQLATEVARLRELLDEPEAAAPAPLVDLSVRQLATAKGLSVSTIRGRCERGEYPGAYLDGRQWRIPASAIEAYQASTQYRESHGVELGDWRQHLKKTA